MSDNKYATVNAAQDFRRARNRGTVNDIMARLTGRPADLLSYEEVRRKLHAQPGSHRELKDIPLDAIVGSVGRYTDFNRQFLPRNKSDEHRWARVSAAVNDMTGVPPIDVYQIGDVYFVLDGNHRVSVARQEGANAIQAYVTEVKTRVPITPDTSPDDLILKAEFSEFLEHTNLDQTRPDADLSVTNPGQYRAIERDIDDWQEHLGQQGQELSQSEAAANWYDKVYMPIIRIIRQRGLLRDFPGRTETDLYVWISRHRSELEQDLGWSINPSEVASDLASSRSTTPARIVARLGDRLLEAVTPDVLEAGPPPGQWRRDRSEDWLHERISTDILVPVSGGPAGWLALDQAIIIAQHEGGRIAGLHVVAHDDDREQPAALAVREEFSRRCQDAGLAGNLTIVAGNITDQICELARWNDLVVINLMHPPGPKAVARLQSGFHALVQRCPRPILAVPSTPTSLSRALLAYDASPKSDEAMFIAAYLVAQWKIDLTIATISSDLENAKRLQTDARTYFEQHGIPARFITLKGTPSRALLKAQREHECNLILIGGYSSHPLLEVVIGSTTDHVLRASQVPVLICR